MVIKDSMTTFQIMADLRRLGYKIHDDFEIRIDWENNCHKFSSPYEKLYSYVVIKYS